MRFRDWLDRLDATGRLTRIGTPVHPRNGAAALLERYEGRPILFENVVGSTLPVAGNLLSRMDLLAESLGIGPAEWIARLTEARARPGEVREGRADFEYLEPDLRLLPLLTHYPGDQGPYVTSGVVFARRHESRNLSFHRLSRIGNDRLVGRLVEKRDLHTMYLDARDHGEDLEVSIAIGNRTGVLVAGATSVERGVYELGLAAALEGGIEVVSARTNGTSYPVDTEIVLEGRILHDETAPEGPFVDLTHTYDGVRVQPVFAIDRIARHRDAVYHALLPGGNEHRLLMGAPRTPTIHRALVEAGIDVRDVYLTEGGSGWLDAVVAIQKHRDADPRVAIEAAIRGHRSLKKVTIVDADVDVTDPHAVNYAVTMYWEAGKEVVLRNVQGSSLDPMATPEGIGSKLAIDATRPLAAPAERRAKMTRARLAPGTPE
ncbi:MAG TPA: UbiD family decarboxylase [Thermoplasmata archaeon]|nr:UbiD family decarboxylase [Thermoplasmata archaeon]